MGTPYLPAANMDRRDGDKIRLQQIQGIAHAGYVGNGIQCAQLMIVDIAHPAAMGLGLRQGNGVIYRFGMAPDLRGQLQAVYQPGGDAPGCAVCVLMAVCMAVAAFTSAAFFVRLLLIVDYHLHARALNAA